MSNVTVAPKQMPIRASVEIENMRANIEKQKAIIEYLSMMTDVEIPDEEDEIDE